MTLHFVTGSAHKVAEIRHILPEVVQLEIDLPEIQELDAHRVIEAKITEALRHHTGPLIVEDTSLYFDCLGGLPGPLIKWFLKAVGNAGLVHIAEVLGNTAEARTIIGYAHRQGNISFFEGTLRGTIVAPMGESSFGWDPIFMPDGHSKTFADMSADEKAAISMRRIAAEKLKTFLETAD